jgi:hypothetical protein
MPITNPVRYDREIQEANHVIGKMKSVLRSPQATREEKSIAQDRLTFWQGVRDKLDRLDHMRG